MEINIKSIHFEATTKLADFINKKADKLARRYPAITSIDVILKVVKPETAMNKDALIRVVVPQHDDYVASKVADSFEEAIDVCLDAIDRQLERKKNAK